MTNRSRDIWVALVSVAMWGLVSSACSETIWDNSGDTDASPVGDLVNDSGTDNNSKASSDDHSKADTEAKANSDTDSDPGVDGTHIDEDSDDLVVDSDGTDVAFIDEDSDGWMAEFDCDDADPGINQDQEEIYSPPNGIDDDCDGLTDEPPSNPKTGIVGIPETCDEAKQAASTVGCLFYAVDLDNGINGDVGLYAVVVSNVHKSKPATVSVHKGREFGWEKPNKAVVPPMGLHVFELPDYHPEESGLWPKRSFKVESDIPIVAYQFNPLDGERSYMSDASLLFPVSSLSQTYDIVGWESAAEFTDYETYFTVVAVTDGTQVTVTPSVIPKAGGVVPASTNPFTVDMDEGDVLQVSTSDLDVTFTGSRVVSNSGHPIAVFTGAECSMIPTEIYACDHLEEQVPGARFWGKEFVAARVPVRSTDPLEVDGVFWQIYAFRDNTEISLTAANEVTGLPFSIKTLSSGDLVQFTTGGVQGVPGDFHIISTEPIAVMQYMTGSSNPYAEVLGDPSMIYVNPVEQFLPLYVVLVPTTWQEDALVITRSSGVGVLLNGAILPDAKFSEVFGTDYEVARITVEDGVHTVESEDNDHGVGVIVIGWDSFDSYAYTGGMGMLPVNPDVL